MKSSLQTLAVRVVVILLGLGAGVMNARWLGPRGVGILALLLLVKYITFRFGNLGFGSAIAFYTARKAFSTARIARVVFSTGAIASVFGGLAVLLVWQRGFSPWQDITPHLFYLGLAAIPFTFFNNFLGRLLSGQLRITEMNAADLITAAANAVFVAVLVVALETGVAGAIISALISDVVTLLYLASRLRKRDATAESTPAMRDRNELVGQLWRYGRWNYLLMITNFLSEELPLILLKSFSENNAQVGLFSKARGLGRYFRVVTLPVSQVLFPFTAASNAEEATRRTQVLCRNSLPIMVLVTGLLAACVKKVILILYGGEFLPAAAIFYALAPGVVLYPILQFSEVHVAASGHPRPVFFASFCTFLAAVVSCWWLIPRYDAIGAGLSVSVTCAVGALLRLLVFSRITGTSVSTMLIPRKGDWMYYQRIWKTVASTVSRT